jgi:phosphoenolpyruvate carboxylase
MPVQEALPVARAFAHFLTLANIAEQHHRIRRRRFYERDPDAQPQVGSCDETFGRLRRPACRPRRCTRRSRACRSSWCSRRTRPR